MERVFTEAVGKKFKPGDRRDYSQITWAHMAKNAGKPLDSFTRATGELAAPIPEKRGPGRPRNN